MISLKNILLLFGIIGIAVFVINDILYYGIFLSYLLRYFYVSDINYYYDFLEHIIIGWLIFISTALTFILLYKEKKK
tara:strand:- start:174 stop:404 length:231 start_codon:yes stop_codon:yes gene_type:complete